MNDVLCQELSRLIFSSIGAIPSVKELVGLQSKECLRKEKITIEVDGKRERQGIWFGEIIDHSGSCQAILTAYMEEYTLVLNHNDTMIGVRFDWSGDDPGLFLGWFADDSKWIPLTLSQKLMLAMILNDIRDDGCLWQVPMNGAKTWPELHERLLSIIEHEDVDTPEKSD